MTDDQMFGLANAAPLLGWIALALAPLNRPLAVRVARVWAIGLAVAYTILVGAALAGASGPMPDLGSLDGLARAFSNPHVMLIGWVHYLSFDLWVGAWETEDAPRGGVPHALLLPCLALTFLAGPVGLLLFVLVRVTFPLAWRRRTHDMT